MSRMNVKARLFDLHDESVLGEGLKKINRLMPSLGPGEGEILMFLAKTSLHYPIPYQVKCTTPLGNVGREYYPIRQSLLA